MIKFIRIFLLVLIILGVVALITQKTWVPKVVEWILVYEGTTLPLQEEDNNTTANLPIAGCYVAKLANDVYTLDIQSEGDGNVGGMLAFNNYEKDSSFGSFTGEYKNGILLGEYYYNSEGVDTEMQVVFKKIGNTFVRGYWDFVALDGRLDFTNLGVVTYDPNSTFIKNENCKELFTEMNNKFTFEYNPLFKGFERNQETNLPDTDWRKGTKEKGMLLAHVSIPKGFLPNTNFSDAVLTIGASTVPNAIKSCTMSTGEGDIENGERTVSGYPFKKFVSTGAGAGNFYETVSYRGLLDGDCYVLEYTIHSTNLLNYPENQDIKEFAQSKIQGELEGIIESFKFLVNSD